VKKVKSKETLVLIVDDEPDACWALEHLVQKAGAGSERAASGCEALDLMTPQRFRVAFLDAKLPDIEGLELAKRLREIDPDISIVIVSGYFSREDEAIQGALGEGLICRFISKPFQNEEIIAAIRMASSSANSPGDI
jgi:CheY-like chemotaxis protein